MRSALRLGSVLAGFILGAACAGNASAAASPDGLWNDVAENAIARSAQARQIVPLRYRTIELDRGDLAGVLAQAPLESLVPAGRSSVRLSLPLADGGFGEFQIVEAPIMEPALAAKFPEIRTYLGQGIDDRSATLRFDVTPTGFHGQIISWEGTTYIDPFQPGDLDHYIAYHKRDAQEVGERPRCEVTGQELPKDAPNFQKRGVAVKVFSGTQLRTYRTAVAATGEYTAFHGGTVAGGLAAIVTTLNRVTGIYEREVAARLVLVANNNLLVYTNAATDPYANSSGDLNANQTNITAVIGTANFDIGHLVGTGGGGVAGLGVVCSSTQKALGLTGSPSPVGDPFDVDYVAHEMGHQFGGNHTFNSTADNCGGGNRNASTAYEVGSGISIQAYAGICAPDNVQNNSSDYFTRASLNEILAFTTNGASGASCGAQTATGNTPPTVTTTAAYTIPARTPFALTAAGSDANGDTLTYLWEQHNLGASNPAGSLVDNGASPIFRGYNPTTSPTRTFPALASILSGANGSTWELLPTTTRTLNFRVTARDNRAGGGGTNEASTALSVVNTGTPFAVTAPNTAVTW
ncbi:MAG TPA: zinc-dependent metalloprotease family protein, partial [Xanthomonadales bacterium]|nr:zinc-dependent metalloprotease family protein [Xanthomonadales bacterium]